MIHKTVFLVIIIILIASCKQPTLNNTLSTSESADGWQLLFDGTSIDKWRNFKKNELGPGWIIDEESIHLNVKKDSDGKRVFDGGDIISKSIYKDFELKLDWKIAACGNSGIMFNVKEDDQYNYVWQTGPEMQILDNDCHPEGRHKTHRAGDLFDLMESSVTAVNKAGQWNSIVIRSKNGKVELKLNNQNVITCQMHSQEWKDLVEKSKFRDMSGFGIYPEGHISLQDHGDKVWFRNIKIREI